MSRGFRFPFRTRADVRQDVEDEFAFHLDMRAADLVRDGLDEAQARAQALREFGDRDRGAASCAALGVELEAGRRTRWRVSAWQQGLRAAPRLFWRRPVFSIVIVGTLALGIGANTAIFSIFEQLLLRPLPVAAPGTLVNLASPGIRPGSDSCNEAGDCDTVFSYPMFRDLQREQDVFTGIAAHRTSLATVTLDGHASNGYVTLVSGNYFPLLGLTPSIGRLLTPADDAAEGASDAVVLSHDYWRTRHASSPDVLGTSVVVNGRTLVVVGVAPAGFHGTTLGFRPMAFVPMSLAGAILPNGNDAYSRSRHWLYLFARLRPGVSLDQAHAGINVPYRDLLRGVETPFHSGLSERQVELLQAKTMSLSRGARGQSALHATTRAPLTLLLVVSLTVLLVACANVANLLLARAVDRASEMAIRMSVGAGRSELVVLLLGEACVLAAAGGLAGLIVAKVTLSFFAAMLPQDGATTLTFALDVRAVTFAAVLSAATGLLFGLYPALQSTRRDLIRTLKDRAGQPDAGRGAARFRVALVTAQIAMATTLLVCAGLFTRSLANVTAVDVGMDVERVSTFRLLPVLSGYAPERAEQMFEQLERDLAALPGVTAASASRIPILASSTTGGSVRIEGYDNGPDSPRNVRYNEVGADYLRTLGMPLRAGRSFAEADGQHAPRVAIVNETFVRRFNLGDRAVGTRIADWTSPDEGFDTEIVGVVADSHYSEVKGDVPAMVLRPYRQTMPRGYMVFYVRSTTAPSLMLADLPRVVARLDPYLGVEGLRTLERQVEENVYVDRLVGLLSAAYAAMATLLAALGLYGVLSYTVGQRTREFGLRMALGADASRIRHLVLGQVVRLATVGGLLGLGAAFVVGRTAQSLLYDVDGHDPLVVTLAAATLAAVTLAAGYIPARRASKLAPMEALRTD